MIFTYDIISPRPEAGGFRARSKGHAARHLSADPCFRGVRGGEGGLAGREGEGSL